MNKEQTGRFRLSSRHENPRNGSILVLSLVVLIVVSALMMATVRSSLGVRRQLRTDLQLEQTRWLLQAACDHVQLKNSAEKNLDLTVDALTDWELDAFPRCQTTVRFEPLNEGGRQGVNVTARIKRLGIAGTVTTRSSTVWLGERSDPKGEQQQ